MAKKREYDFHMKFLSTFFVEGKTVMVNSEMCIDTDAILRALVGKALNSKGQRAQVMGGAVRVNVSNRRIVG